MSKAEQILNNEKAYWARKTEHEWLSDQGVGDVLALMPSIAGDVLELCSGSGMFTRRVPRTYQSYTCLDLSPTLLTSIQSARPDIRIVEGNAEEPPLPPSSYDTVLIFAGIHHLGDIPKTLMNAHKLLRPGGRLIAFEPNKDCWYRAFMLPFRNLLGLYTEDEVFLSPEYLKKELQALQFDQMALSYVTPAYKPSHLNVMNAILAGFMKRASSFAPGKWNQSFFIISGQKRAI